MLRVQVPGSPGLGGAKLKAHVTATIWLAVGLNGNADRDQQEVELLQMSLMCIKLIAVAIENFGQCVVSQANNHCGMLVTAAASNHLSYLHCRRGEGNMTRGQDET